MTALFVGQAAARLMASEGRKIAENLPPAKRGEMLQLCDEVDMLTDQLGNLCKKGQVCNSNCGMPLRYILSQV